MGTHFKHFWKHVWGQQPHYLESYTLTLVCKLSSFGICLSLGALHSNDEDSRRMGTDLGPNTLSQLQNTSQGNLACIRQSSHSPGESGVQQYYL